MQRQQKAPRAPFAFPPRGFAMRSPGRLESWLRGRRIMVIPKLPKLEPWVRFPSPAPLSRQCWPMRANDLPLAVPSNKFADVRWYWLWFYTQSRPYDRVRPQAARGRCRLCGRQNLRIVETQGQSPYRQICPLYLPLMSVILPCSAVHKTVHVSVQGKF